MASVLDLVKHYQHAIEKYPDDERKIIKCIDKLFHLNVTVQHLQDTGVGRTVNALRKEPGNVGQASRALVNKWKCMVAAEESDNEPEHNNDTSHHNGHGSGKDSDSSANNSSGMLSQQNETMSRTKSRQEDNIQINGDHSGSKRKYQSSEEEETHTKKTKHTNSSDTDDCSRPDTKVKVEQNSKTETDQDSSQSEDSDSDTSQSSKDEMPKQKIKHEPKEKHASFSKHSQNNDDRKRESSTKKTSDSERQSSHSSKHSSEKSKESNHKHSCSKERENSSVKKPKSDHKSDKDKRHKTENGSSSKHSEDKHRSISHKSETSSDRHKSDKSSSEKHRSSSQSNKSEKDKHKHFDKEISDKRKEGSSSKHSSSKEKKESSRDKSSSHKSVKSHSSTSESKSRSDKKEKNYDKSDKSKHKSSSSMSSKSSKHKEDIPKKNVNGQDSDDGIDCGSGASFAEALGIMISPAKSKKKPLKDVNSPSNPFSNIDLSPAALLAPNAKLLPLPPIEISALPEISPNYKPRPPPKLMPHFPDEDAMSQVISSKNQRTKVYSGNKVYGKMPSLYELCVNVLQEHIDALEFTGGVPYDILKPVVDRATPQQLFMLEHYNPYLMEDTDHLWKGFCEKSFRNKKRQEMETWREMFMRCQEEQESKLKSLTANIKMTQEARKAPIKQTKMAYVDSVVKPPRNIARKQAQHGTAHAAAASPAARVASLASAPNVLKGGVRPSNATPVSLSTFNKPKKAPLMQKALQFMRGRKR